MSHSMTRHGLAFALAATTLATSGCGVLLDGAYLVSSKRYDESVPERKPTGQVHTAVEYEAVLGTEGLVHLTCEERERRVERASSVNKTFEYRGSYQAPPYIAAAVLSGLVGGAITGVIAAICTQKPENPTVDQLSCLNMIYATPFAADVGWSVIRAATAKPPKLVKKETSEAVLAFSEKPTRTAPLRCDSVQVVLGDAVGAEPSAADILGGAEAENRPHLLDGATAVAFAPDGTIALRTQPEVVKAWLDNAALKLWVVDPEGKPHALRVDRCGALRPTADVLASDVRVRLQQACPPPPPPASPPR